MARQIRLGDLLVERGLIKQEELRDALSKQQEMNLRLGETLVESGYVTEDDIAITLSDQYNIPFAQISNLTFQPEALNLLNQSLVEKHQVVPIAVEDDVLTLATADPTDVMALDDIHYQTDKKLKLVVVTKRDIERAIEWLYLEPSGDNERTLRMTDIVNISDDDAPLIRMVNAMILQAVEDQASDIHVEPGDYNLKVRYRVDGQLQVLRELSMDLHNPIVARFKIMSNLDISERRLPQDGAFRQIIKGREIDFRVSIIPTIRGEKVVLRIHDNTQNKFSIESLGMQPNIVNEVRNVLKLPYGMLLVTGPTGSGKTTTLYSCLEILNSPYKNIITIEDPTEYRLNGINQVTINARIGLTYASVLRAVLRQDPNIVMVGEIRDTETAEIAIRAALTGHLVLSTLHTNDAASTLTRLIDMGVPEFLIASSVVGIIAQRLVRKVCPRCHEEYIVSDEEPLWQALDVEKHLGEDINQVKLKKAGRGCTHCYNTGYKGRVGVFEFLKLDEEITKMVVEREPASKIKSYALSNLDMTTLKDDAAIKVLQGITTVEELMSISYIKQE
ncbi:MAG: GspE/PulE family protein [Clostridia bacterium]